MILHFCKQYALQLALTSGAVPAEVSAAPVVAGFREDGGVLVQPAAKVPAAAQKKLQRLGVQMVRNFGPVVAFECLCWAQVLPLQEERPPVSTADQTPVLFELPDAKALPELTAEILRLGNDRQSFRYLGDGEATSALLRVYGPPYYSLLQALERDGRQE